MRNSVRPTLLSFSLLLACSSDPSMDTTGNAGGTEGVSSGDGSGTTPPDDSGDGGSSSGNDGNGSTPKYHPAGFAEAQVHGEASKLQEEDCRSCHGQDLQGIPSNGPSCDGCHPSDWRTDCTFCHGGDDNQTGAPPRDIVDDGTTSFEAHTAHVLANAIHGDLDCVQCHTKPTNILSAGHMFDDTPGTAEVQFASGLSAEGQYSDGTCSSLYCHGSGRGPDGVATRDMPAPDCGGCHGFDQPTSWSTMSGQHQRHLSDGLACADCHGNIVDASNTITNVAHHVDGYVAIVPAEGVSFNGTGCTGLCHSKLHFANTWQ